MTVANLWILGLWSHFGDIKFIIWLVNDKTREADELNETVEEYEYEIDQLKQQLKEVHLEISILNGNFIKFLKIIYTVENNLKINKKYDTKLESIGKMTLIIEKELWSKKLDLKKYNHKTSIWGIKELLYKGCEGEICTQVQNLLEIIDKNGDPEIAEVHRPPNIPIGRSPQPNTSSKFEDIHQSFGYRGSMMSNISSFTGESVMTDIEGINFNYQ